VAALERLAVRQISSRFVSQEERIEIADLRHAGWSIRQIAQQLGRAPSTVSRELRRNAASDGRYRPFDAHRRATARRTRNHRWRIDIIGELRQVVAELLDQRWSPQADQPSFAGEVRRAAQDVAVPREHVSGYLPAGIGIAAAIPAGAAPSLTAAHQARSPARSSAHRTASAEIPPADAHDSPAAVPARGPLPTGALGISMLLSSRLSELGWCCCPGSVLAEQRPKDVDPAAGEGDDGLAVSAAVGSFLEVVVAVRAGSHHAGLRR
jgi:transposase-like protein